MVSWVWIPIMLALGAILGFVFARANDKKFDQLQADLDTALKKL